MTDIVEQLRASADGAETSGFTDAAEILREAADEIERLREQLVGADRVIKAAHWDCDCYRAEIKLMQAELEEYRR